MNVGFGGRAGPVDRNPQTLSRVIKYKKDTECQDYNLIHSIFKNNDALSQNNYLTKIESNTASLLSNYRLLKKKRNQNLSFTKTGSQNPMVSARANPAKT